jgi:hypothetical protein
MFPKRKVVSMAAQDRRFGDLQYSVDHKREGASSEDALVYLIIRSARQISMYG